MDFELTTWQQDIVKAVREFTAKEFTKEKAAEYDLKGEFPWEIYRKAAELGFIGVNFPEEYGGQGYGTVEAVLITEELCRADSNLGIALTLATLGADLILDFGTEEQKMRYLPRLAKGEILSAVAFTEPDHGSDITQLSTTAVLENGEWVINGVKTFITNSPIAEFFIVECQTDPNTKPPYRGQTLILVERNRKGITTEKIEKMGARSSLLGEIVFDNVRVPMENVIGRVNQGFYHTMHFLNKGRIIAAAIGVGIAQGALDRAMDYAKKRVQFGQPIGQFQAIQHKIANMAIEIEAARLLTHKAAWLVDKGRPDPVMSSMAKAYAARVAIRVVDEALQIHGGYGYSKEYDIERFYRDVRFLDIGDGTGEIQRNLIAKRLLKL